MKLKNYLVLIAAAAATGALSFSAQANAIPLDGGVSFNITGYAANGTGVGDLDPVANILTVSSLSSTTIASSDPDFASLVGKTPSFNLPIALYALGNPTLNGVFFSVVTGGNTWYFTESEQNGGNYTHATHNGQTSVTYTESGFGWVEELAGVNNPLGALIAGGIQDQGTWTLELQDSGTRPGAPTHPGGSSSAIFTYTAVPDGGMTITLLGGAFLGLHAIRRKLSR
jgi:hypothetical protein